MTKNTKPEFVAETEAAAILSVSRSFLRHDRCAGRKPRVPYAKVGRMIRYRISDLNALVGGL
jgi:hypothetical protein